MNRELVINLVYLCSALSFVFGLKLMSSPETARKGNFISALGMFVAVLVTLLDLQIVSYQMILIGVAVGALIGIPSALLVEMTAMPEMVALLNGSGGFSSLFLGWATYQNNLKGLSSFESLTVILSVLIGGVTFSGSLIAWGKLKGIKFIPSRAFLFKGQRFINFILLFSALAFSGIYVADCCGHFTYTAFLITAIVSLILGILVVLPIGGADMPVVISLLNSYSGLAACAAGFAIRNNLLIVAGSLVGASGIILTSIMCKAMNRSLGNVLFSGFGASEVSGGGGDIGGEMKPSSTEDAYYVLEAAKSVVVVPGYGLAVAQAQHVVRELGEILEENGAEVKYAIHPVAGRMPGHMNVLLAEANVPYDQLVEMDEINPTLPSVDVCIVIGANDVVNPSARDDEKSPIYGMPIINVDYARTVYVLKRGKGKGFAGIENPLFYKDNTRFLFGDAKATVSQLISEFKSE